jgi:integrase/recombinase XerD
VLFLTNTGESFTPNRLTQLVRNYVDAAQIGKRGACHLFRHTMATIMLENGADIRFIQEMLGHAELSTTQIYTQVSIKKLKEIHTATHPSARVSRERVVAAEDAGDDPEPEA